MHKQNKCVHLKVENVLVSARNVKVCRTPVSNQFSADNVSGLKTIFRKKLPLFFVVAVAFLLFVVASNVLSIQSLLIQSITSEDANWFSLEQLALILFDWRLEQVCQDGLQKSSLCVISYDKHYPK